MSRSSGSEPVPRSAGLGGLTAAGGAAGLPGAAATGGIGGAGVDAAGFSGAAGAAGGADGADTAAGGAAAGVTVESADLSMEGMGPGTRSQIRTATLASATAAPIPSQR